MTWTVPGLSVAEELRRSFERPELSDYWSHAAERIYFDAAVFHGLEVKPSHVPDIYSYALEACEALRLLPPLLSVDERLAGACWDWHSGRLARREFLERVTEICERAGGSS